MHAKINEYEAINMIKRGKIAVLNFLKASLASLISGFCSATYQQVVKTPRQVVVAVSSYTGTLILSLIPTILIEYPVLIYKFV
jgi:hypothetical protein